MYRGKRCGGFCNICPAGGGFVPGLQVIASKCIGGGYIVGDRDEVPGIISNVTLNVYSILGELVETLINNQDYEIGNYEVEFDAGLFASGVYLYRINAGEFVQTKKMVLMK